MNDKTLINDRSTDIDRVHLNEKYDDNVNDKYF